MISAIVALLVLIAVVILTSTVFKVPAPFGLVISALASGLVAGVGLPLTNIVEGSYGFFYIVLTFGCGLIFVKVMTEIGFNEAIKGLILNNLKDKKVLLFLSLMAILMIPGMLTGIGSVAVISTGAVVASVLSGMGMPKSWTAVFIVTGAILGMIAPPVNLPLMYMGVLIALPYAGFTKILLLMTIPLAVFFALFIGYRFSGKETLPVLDLEQNLKNDNQDNDGVKSKGFLVYLPITVVIVLLVLERVMPVWVDLGLPLILLIGALVGLPATGFKKFFNLSAEALKGQGFIILMIIVTAGVKGEFLSLSGVRGLLATFFFAIIPAWLFLPSLISLPLLGAFGTVFGATFILGYPLVLALLPKSSIICAAALSMIAAVADIMPPTALSGNIAAHLVGEKLYRKVFARALFPAIVMILVAIIVIVFADPLSMWLA